MDVGEGLAGGGRGEFCRLPLGKCLAVSSKFFESFRLIPLPCLLDVRLDAQTTLSGDDGVHSCVNSHVNDCRRVRRWLKWTALYPDALRFAVKGCQGM